MDIAGLGYCVIGATAPRRWIDFGEQLAGFAAEERDGAVLLRMDERAVRMLLLPAATDQYRASGWELRSRRAFAAAQAELAAKGIGFEHATAADCVLRGVGEMIWLLDPAGNRHELFHGPTLAHRPFRSPAGVERFVTGLLGMGHVVLPAPNIDQTRDFLHDVLGFEVSDYMTHRPLGADGPTMRIDFLHCDNPRHHSLALFEGEVPAGCVHLMVELPTLDEVGRAHDRIERAGARLMATLGRHSNDHMVSFYLATPGGFALEYGFGGLQVDWTTHSAFEFTTVSDWGHDFSVGFGADERARLAAVA